MAEKDPGRESPLTPHNRYFRYVFGQPEPARNLLVTLQTASGRELAVHMLFEHKARNEPGTSSATLSLM